MSETNASKEAARQELEADRKRAVSLLVELKKLRKGIKEKERYLGIKKARKKEEKVD